MLQRVTVREIVGRDADLQHPVPEIAGIYVWFLAIPPSAGDSPAMVKQLIDALSGVVGLEWRKRLGLYSQLTLHEVRVPHTQDSVEILAKCLGGPESDERTWLLELLVRYQRALYVGKATDLRARISGHLREDSKLRRSLAQVGIDPLQCAINFHPAPDSLIEGDLAKFLALAEAATIRIAMPLLNARMEN